MPGELSVEVVPISVDRWVAVIPAPSGSFSTEADVPEAVAQEVVSAMHEVMGKVPPHRLVGANGDAWTPDVAAAQAAVLRG